MSAKLVDFNVKSLGDVKFIGKEIICKLNHPEGNPIPDFWMKCFKDDTFKALDTPDRMFINAMIGWCGDFNSTDNTFSYMVGGFVKKTSSVPAGFKKADIYDKNFAVGTIIGTEPEIYQKAYDLTREEALKRTVKLNEGYAMEWYDERFDPNAEEKTIDLLIPAK